MYSQYCYVCSAQICLTHIRSLSSSTGVLMSQSPKWPQADFGRHYSQYLAFTAKKASFYEVAHCPTAIQLQARLTCSHLHEQLWHAGSKNLYQAVVQQAANQQLYKGDCSQPRLVSVCAVRQFVCFLLCYICLVQPSGNESL